MDRNKIISLLNGYGVTQDKTLVDDFICELSKGQVQVQVQSEQSEDENIIRAMLSPPIRVNILNYMNDSDQVFMIAALRYAMFNLRMPVRSDNNLSKVTLKIKYLLFYLLIN